MASRITHVNCPQCGGTLGTPSGRKIVECLYCGQESLVEREQYLPRYFIAPAIKESGARRAVGKILTDPEAPERLIKQARFLSANLYFVPFYELSGKRVGTFTMKTKERQGYTRRHEYKKSSLVTSAYPAAKTFRTVERTYGPKAFKYDTRVIMNDVLSSYPAVRLPEWGLEGVDFDRIRSEKQGLLHPFLREKMEAFGRIFDPKVSEDKVVQESIKMIGISESRDNTKMVEWRNKLIYYPLWRVRYTYKGRSYGVTVDGASGEVLAARIPMSEKGRIAWMLVTSAMAGLFVGKLLRMFMYIFQGAEIEEIFGVLFNLGLYLAPVWLILMGLMFMVIAFGWDRFRYSSEMEIRGDRRKVIKVNRPETTRLDRISGLFMKLSSMIVRQTVRSRRQRW